jgi:hypothetical protein
MASTLSTRALNRALLARQLVLERVRLKPLAAIERVAGLQAQLARPPFIGLWTRLQNFERSHLLALIAGRKVLRATTMRGTIHLVSTRDLIRFRATLQPMLAAGAAAIIGKGISELDLERIIAAGREILGEKPRAFDELRPLLAARELGAEARALAYIVRMHLPLVQLPSDVAWGWDAKAAFAVAESWLGEPLSTEVALADLVRRYLAAFGPATPADMTTWSGLRGTREIFEQLRGELRVFRDERGRELFDVPAGARPSPETEVPVRLLPEYDNLILSHDDRSRVVRPEHRALLATRNLQVPGTFLVDGFVAGTWKVERKRKTAVLALTPFVKLTKRDQSALGEEGIGLLRFAESEAAEHDVRFVTRA